MVVSAIDELEIDMFIPLLYSDRQKDAKMLYLFSLASTDIIYFVLTTVITVD